jgi:uncharacterized membrane protein
MPLLFEIAKWSHVIAGVASLLAAPVAMIAHKGGRTHRVAGQVYFWGMAVIFVTALVMSFYRPNIFLIAVSVLSFYGAFSGRRALLHKRTDRVPAGRLDWFAAIAAGIMGVAVGAWGAWQIAAGALAEGPFPILGIVFGALIVSGSLSDFRRFRQLAAKNEWWFIHMNQMLGSYIGLLTAFLVQTVAPRLLEAGMPFDWIWIVWIAPTIIGTPAIAYWIGVWRRRLGKVRAQPVVQSAT